MSFSCKYDDLAVYAKMHSIAKAVRLHNDMQSPIDLHDVFVLSHDRKASEDLHMSFTTPHMLFN